MHDLFWVICANRSIYLCILGYTYSKNMRKWCHWYFGLIGLDCSGSVTCISMIHDPQLTYKSKETQIVGVTMDNHFLYC